MEAADVARAVILMLEQPVGVSVKASDVVPSGSHIFCPNMYSTSLMGLQLEDLSLSPIESGIQDSKVHWNFGKSSWGFQTCMGKLHAYRAQEKSIAESSTQH